jgi:hypothetical protein
MTTRTGMLPLAVVLSLACATGARADDFSDFRIPPNRMLLWTGHADVLADWQRNDGGTTKDNAGREQETLLSQFLYRGETDSRTTEVHALGLVRGFRGNSTSLFRGPIGQTVDDARQRRTLESWSLSVAHRWFPERWRIGLVADAAGAVTDEQFWASSHSLTVPLPGGTFYQDFAERTAQWTYRTDVSGDVGLGVGRVRSATGVFEAMLIERRLRAARVLTRPLGSVARRELAALLYARTDYSTSMDRPAATVWGTIEDILRRDGAIADSALDARALFGLAEPYIGRGGFVARDGLPVSPVLRPRGWFANVVLSGRTTHQIDRGDFASSSSTAPGGVPFVYTQFQRISSGSDVAEAGVNAEYHRPCGARWQLDAALSVLTPIRRQRNGIDESSAVSVAWLVADRWLAETWVSHSRRIDKSLSGVTDEDTWQVTYAGTCEFWVTDRVAIQLQVEQVHARMPTLVQFASLPTTFSRAGQLQFGIDYRFAGFTEIPGLISPTTR